MSGSQGIRFSGFQLEASGSFPLEYLKPETLNHPIPCSQLEACGLRLKAFSLSLPHHSMCLNFAALVLHAQQVGAGLVGA